MENELKEPAYKYNFLSAEEYLAPARKITDGISLASRDIHKGINF